MVIAPRMAVLLLGSLAALLALLGLAALIGLTTWFAASGSGASEGRSSPTLPAATGRDPWTPIVAGLRHRASARGGKSVLGAIYEKRSYRPFWVTPLSLNESGRSLLAHLAGPGREEWGGDEHQLNEIGHLHRLAFPAPLESNPHAIAELDWVLSMTFVRYGTSLMEGRAPWARGEEDWHLPGERFDAAGMFRQLETVGVPGALDGFLTSHEPYTSLRDALFEYRAVARAGGWPGLEEGDTLRLGDRSPRVRTLRRRLRVTEDLTSAHDVSSFDEELEEAVRRFQARHGLNEDGSVGAKTLLALNVPVEERIRQLQVNLERRRWLPPVLGQEFLWINVPEFRLRVFRADREVLSMPVVVGAPESPTPSFGERLDRAVVNPSWYVPESIAVNELAPKAARDPDYLRKAEFELLDGEGSLVESEICGRSFFAPDSTGCGEGLDPRTISDGSVSAPESVPHLSPRYAVAHSLPARVARVQPRLHSCGRASEARGISLRRAFRRAGARPSGRTGAGIEARKAGARLYRLFHGMAE